MMSTLGKMKDGLRTRSTRSSTQSNSMPESFDIAASDQDEDNSKASSTLKDRIDASEEKKKFQLTPKDDASAIREEQMKQWEPVYANDESSSHTDTLVWCKLVAVRQQRDIRFCDLLVKCRGKIAIQRNFFFFFSIQLSRDLTSTNRTKKKKEWCDWCCV
mmetsp:Transcript_21422/g.50900  ORF Transcript_21422/g.50900 Transcript_21422/m.50900 type:complete len:160 (-) Transcript_21422:60-539(-)